MVKAFYLLMIDAEKRRGGKETGLDTHIPLSVNDEWWLANLIKKKTKIINIL